MFDLHPLAQKLLVAVVLSCFLPFSVHAQQAETAEIEFNTQDAVPLADQAAKLGNAVAIYEYVYNNFEFEPYHGSRSGSVNTFLGLHGSDVDIASTLIAMLRSQNIPARYVVGTITLTAAQINNWLRTGNIAVATQLLREQGIQGLPSTKSTLIATILNTTVPTVSFEHVWVEALIPFDQYRGLPTPSTVDCSIAANASRCVWVSLDASFKQKTYNTYGLDPYPVAGLAFDYTSYYNAIKNKDAARMNKNPLTILEEQIAGWLQIPANQGKTLDDVANVGKIVQIHDGLLPASLPYSVTGTPRVYDSVDAHDAAVASPTTAAKPEAKKWGKYLTVTINMPIYDSNGNHLTDFQPTDFSPIRIALINLHRLTLHTVLSPATNTSVFTISYDGTPILTLPVNYQNYYPQIGDPYDVTLTLDGAPDSTGGANDFNYTHKYSSLLVGGYHLIMTGGAYSNWSQVHRAAYQLEADNANYPIVFDPNDPGSNGQACNSKTGLNCTPYVDINNTGVWAANDPTLLADSEALDALTGGLLYVAGNQYIAEYVDKHRRLNSLMRTSTPMIGFAGLVSSVYEAEYVHNTAFSIMPGGLYIDIGGFGGASYRFDGTLANGTIEPLKGHIGSSLEHEIWQELTGYDAVSTVRGMQMALANPSSTLVTIPNKTALINNYATFGFGTTLPTGFVSAPFTIFANKPAAWTNTTAPSSFETLLRTVTSTTSALNKEVQTYTYDPQNLFYPYAWEKCTSNLVASINALPAATVFPTSSISQTCYGGPPITGTKAAALSIVQADWNTIVPGLNALKADQFDYFDTTQGFTTTGRLYRPYPPTADQYSGLAVAALRNSFDLAPAGTTMSYTMPSTNVITPNNRFVVYINAVKSSSGNEWIFAIYNLGK
jgi:transglutaminase-like putative cysteine protease